MEKITEERRPYVEKLLRECGALAYVKGRPLTELSPLVTGWRRDAWWLGWKAARSAARKGRNGNT